MIDAKKLWEAAKANTAALLGCAGPHEFVDLTPQKSFGKRYRCTRCTGEVDGVEKTFYDQGLKHGRK